jgi:hypothetical protein
MTRKILTIAFFLSLTGCLIINSGPKDNFEFSTSTHSQDFEGVYKNLGDPKSIYLTQLLFKDRIQSNPRDPLIKDEMGNLVSYGYIIDNLGRKVIDPEIEAVEVSPSANSITINAIKNGCIIYSKEYLSGRDFTISEGKITLSKETHLLTRGGVGDVILGPSYEKTELGLDTMGNGKYKSQGYFAGIVCMLIPMAGGGADEVKFEKIVAKEKFSSCK